jgi:hypothetical protein
MGYTIHISLIQRVNKLLLSPILFLQPFLRLDTQAFQEAVIPTRSVAMQGI